MPYSSNVTGALARLLSEQGQIAADRSARSGQIWGTALGNIGQRVAGRFAEAARRREEEPRRRLEALQMKDAEATLLDRDRMRGEAKKLDAVNGFLTTLASVEDPKAVYAQGRQQLIDAGIFAPQDAPDFFPGMGWVKARMAQTLPAAERFKQLFPEEKYGERDPSKDLYNQRTGEVTSAGVPKPADPFTLGPGQQRFGPDGQPLASVPAAPPRPMSVPEGGVLVDPETGKVVARGPAKSSRGDGLTPNAGLEGTLKLRDRFVRETQAASTVKTQLELMKSSLAAVKVGAAAPGSQGVLVTFQKILDPTSVVRESEYARSASGLSLLSRIEGKWQTIEKGGAGVPVKDLEDFVKLSEQFMQNQARAAQDTKRQIDAIATEYGLKPENITRDIGGGGPVRMRAPDGRPLSVPPADVERMKSLGAVEY